MEINTNVYGAVVNHNKFGKGIIVDIIDNEKDSNYYMVISFDGWGKKQLSFPMVMRNNIISTDDKYVIEFYNNAVEKEDNHIAEVEHQRELAFNEMLKKREELEKHIKSSKGKNYHHVAVPFDENCSPDLVKMFRSPLTKDVYFTSDYDKYFTIGFIAAHIAECIVDMSNDREDDFDSIFGDKAIRNVYDYEDGRSICQMSIEFDINTVFPDAIKEAVCKVKYGHRYSIPRSRFVFNLVHDLGFKFGEKQNIDAIYDIVDALGFGDAFMDGFMWEIKNS